MSVAYDPERPELGVRRLRVLRGACVSLHDTELRSRTSGKHVGDIVCFGDRVVVTISDKHPVDGAVQAGHTTMLFVRDVVVPVSYTHLTLPTILLV